jgi:hypothetical protein
MKLRFVWIGKTKRAPKAVDTGVHDRVASLRRCSNRAEDRDDVGGDAQRIMIKKARISSHARRQRIISLPSTSAGERSILESWPR